MRMKKWCLFLSLYFCLCLLSACGVAPAVSSAEQPEPAPGGSGQTEPPRTGGGAVHLSLDPDEEPTVLTCRIVDGAEDGNLLLAELEDGPYGGTGVYRLDVKSLPVTLDGEATEPSALEDGMPVEISFNGRILESFPAQFGEVYRIDAWSVGSEKSPGGTCYDLCGLYLQVLDDLWRKDPALNENIALAGLDLSQAPGELTESEKAAIAWRFGEAHGVEVVTGTFDELRDQGYFAAKTLRYTGEPPAAGSTFYEWEDGCLFSITPNEEHEGEVYSLPVLHFNAEKWRSPLGAYCFYDCSAGWGQVSTWSGYTIGSEMIS